MLRRIAQFLLFFVLLSTLDQLQASSDRVQQAIANCREKLAKDPTFPPAQFLLGKLLESIPGSNLTDVAE
jgi:hypothetical protein